MEAVIFVGLQGAGKSTFCRERLFHTHVRLSLDMLKTRHRERRLLRACVEALQPFVVDNTNPTRAERQVYIRAAREAGFRVIGYYFQSRVEDCLRRNDQRPEDRRVPPKGILGKAGRMELPSIGEGFDDLYYVGIDEAGGSWSRGGEMKIDDLDGRMRAFEAVLDPTVLPGVFMVARLDGRNFTRLTKETHPFEKPFDGRFHDFMRRTAEHLMDGCGFGVSYGFTQSDEISLLFGPGSDAFGRKLRKLLSILSGEASARFSLLLGSMAVFDCRISQLPSVELVVDYFRWRAEDAHRNALNAHCYWLLRRQGHDVGQATEALRGLSTSAKNELLFRGGINFNDLLSWQKRGSGLYWEEFERPGVNPVTGEKSVARRRRICHDLELPVKEAYSAFLRDLIEKTEAGRGKVA